MIAAAVALVVLFPIFAPDPSPPSDATGSPRASARRDDLAERFHERGRRARFHATGPEVVRTERFVVVRDRANTLPTPPWDPIDPSNRRDPFVEAFSLARDAWYATQPDRAKALMVFSTFDDGGRKLFYLHLANDVEGLGDGKGASIFDDTPGVVLDGAIWMGDVALLERMGQAYFSEAFIHEIAHRWCAYASIDRADLPRDVLRGRESSHWSFFVDTEGDSPIGGNPWVAEGDGSFVTASSDPPGLRFSPLELYAMGLVDAESVPSFSLIRTFDGVSPSWFDAHADREPARRSDTTVRLYSAHATAVSIDDIVRGSGGPRRPRATMTPVVWPIGVVLLADGFSTVSIDDMRRFDAFLRNAVDAFWGATDGRMAIDTSVVGAGTTPFGAHCAELEECDRTASDVCTEVREGEGSICWRTCALDSNCPDEHCCASVSNSLVRMCTPLARCGRTAPEEPSLLPIGNDAGLPATSHLEEVAPTCGCNAIAPLDERASGQCFALLGATVGVFRSAGRLREWLRRRRGFPSPRRRGPMFPAEE